MLGLHLEKDGRAASADERVPHPEHRETVEVAIRGVELTDAVTLAQGRDPRIVHTRAGHSASLHDLSEDVEVARSLGEEDEARRFEPCGDLSQRESRRSGW